MISCVDHRPVRNGLRDESTTKKDTLTQAVEGKKDYWLMKATVRSQFAQHRRRLCIPCLRSELKPVQFRFTVISLQVLVGRQYQGDDPVYPNDDTPTRLERMIMEFSGSHVDVKLRESLDGERTNFLEENYEEGWARRQHFKVDLDKTSMDPIAAIAWYYGE